MDKVNQRTQIFASSPIQVGDRRLLPSVLVTSAKGDLPGGGRFESARMRPVSFVEQGPEGARWHAIPNATQDKLSVMLAFGAGVAVFGVIIMVLARLTRR